jgi:hypothetical protein
MTLEASVVVTGGKGFVIGAGFEAFTFADNRLGGATPPQLRCLMREPSVGGVVCVHAGRAALARHATRRELFRAMASTGGTVAAIGGAPPCRVLELCVSALVRATRLRCVTSILYLYLYLRVLG